MNSKSTNNTRRREFFRLDFSGRSTLSTCFRDVWDVLIVLKAPSLWMTWEKAGLSLFTWLLIVINICNLTRCYS